jgi:predicted DNA-binding helix-hairpin-helix protein
MAPPNRIDYNVTSIKGIFKYFQSRIESVDLFKVPVTNTCGETCHVGTVNI